MIHSTDRKRVSGSPDLTEAIRANDGPGLPNPRLLERGFTLVELLVVIAILAVLAAVIFPVFAATKDHAKRAACTSNLKHIWTALSHYADDWEETYPPNYHQVGIYKYGVTWVLTPYLPEKGTPIWQCPGEPKGGYFGDGPPFLTSYYASFYFFGFPDRCKQQPSRSLDTVERPSEVVMFSEGWLNENAFPKNVARWNSSDEVNGPGKIGMGGWHRGKNQYLFADGRVRYLSVWQTLQPKVLWDNFSEWSPGTCDRFIWTPSDVEVVLRDLETWRGILSK